MKTTFEMRQAHQRRSDERAARARSRDFRHAADVLQARDDELRRVERERAEWDRRNDGERFDGLS